MKNLISVVLAVLFIAGCSAKVDTTQFGPEEHFQYALSLYTDEDYLEALNEFQTILLQYPGSAVNDDTQYYYALTYFQREQYLLSAYEFSKLISNIPASPFVPDAQYMLAECYYRLSPNYQLDQRYTKKAIEEFQAFIDFFPTNEKVEEAENKITEMNDKLAEKEFHSGVVYENMELYTAAIEYYKDVSDTYHDTRFAPDALYRMIKLLISRDKNTEAVNAMSVFLERYPDNSNAAEIRDLYNTMTERSEL